MIKIGSKGKLRFELLADLFARIVNAGTKIWGGFDLKEANACADDTVSVFCCEYLAMLACCQVFEELAATHGASRLQSEVVAHELHGLLQFFAFRLYCCGFHSALFCSRNLVAKLLWQTFVRMF